MAYSTTTSQNLGEILLREGLITDEQYESGRREYDQSERPLARIFVEMGAITEGVKIGVLQKRFHCKLLPLEEIAPRPDALALLPRRDCAKYKVIPVRLEAGQLILAMDDPTDSRTINAIEAIAGRTVRPFLAKVADIDSILDRLPDDSATTDTAQPAGLALRILSRVSLPLVCFVPILSFIAMLMYHRGFQKIYREMDYDPFERVLIFLLLWSAWAIVAYWIDDLIFGRLRRPET